jgi:serine incorporator 1/3
MATLVTCIATSVGFCFCSAMGSLMNACCGNDKPSSVTPGASSGRKRSVLLLVLSIATAFAFQYGVAPAILDAPIDNIVTNAWKDGCEQYSDNVLLLERCAGQNGVYRSAFSALVLFLCFAVAVSCKRTFNREVWPAKYAIFLLLVAAMCCVPNQPLFSQIFLNIARIGGFIFILFQQIVFVDVAHNWNDGWVERSNKADAEESGSGQKWLTAILVSAVILFLASMVGWGLLFYFFAGCATNTAFITITIVLSVLVTACQLSGEEGSLLASSLISAYATMLCYNAVTKNPRHECNPQLGQDDVLSIIIGVGLTVVSIGYVGWSTTADKTLSRGNDDNDDVAAAGTAELTSSQTKEISKVGGLVTNYNSTTQDEEDDTDAERQTKEAGVAEEQVDSIPNSFSNNWKLNIALAVVTCWYSMALTGWGSIEANGTVANPQVGEVNMWIISSSQWFAMLLYCWTLCAPRLFPDRDFS